MLDLERQEEYRQAYLAMRPHHRFANQIYASLVESHLSPQIWALDAGCGCLGVLWHYKDRVSQAVGLDTEFVALKENRGLENRVVGDIAALPFSSEAFDLVLSTWVVEHLSQPEGAFYETARVLRPGGRLLILTPNAHSPLTLASRLLPQRWQRPLARRLYSRQLEQLMPLAYRANTKAWLERHLHGLGLEMEEFHYVGDPSYLAFNGLAFRLGVALERITDWPPLRRLKVHLVASFVKT
jgi:SAM-dependent methyltransferase